MNSDFSIEDLLNVDELVKNMESRFEKEVFNDNPDRKLLKILYKPQHQKKIDNNGHNAYFQNLNNEFSDRELMFIVKLLNQSITQSFNSIMIFLAYMAVIFASIAILSTVFIDLIPKDIFLFIICILLFAEILLTFIIFPISKNINKKQKIANLITYYLDVYRKA